MESSPITKKSNVKAIRKIKVSEIIDEYYRGYDITANSYFSGVEFLYEMECLDSGFGYFSPKTKLGDSFFYEKLQELPWYYEEWKWEHQLASEYIKRESRVLEVGCAEGAFLERLKKTKNIYEFGLELNVKAQKISVEKNLNVEKKYLSDITDKYEASFDAVCTFQVLEHIDLPIEFIADCLTVLKKNGVLILSVPNNDSFIKNTEKNVLNMPPHHSGLWNRKSLRYLEEVLPLKLDSISFEPLQDIHVEWYLGTLIYKYPLLKRGFINKIIRKLIKRNQGRIKGHSIMATFRKL
jgi:SAM-dependent methyltransferase